MAVGWYRLRRGTLFHGPIPPGAVEVAAPGSTESASPVDPGPARPKTSARKQVWVDYVETLIGRPLDGAADTKAELQALADAYLAGGDEAVEALHGRTQVGAPALVDEDLTDPSELVDGQHED